MQALAAAMERLREVQSQWVGISIAPARPPSPEIRHSDETSDEVAVPAICTKQRHRLRIGALDDSSACFYCGVRFDAGA